MKELEMIKNVLMLAVKSIIVSNLIFLIMELIKSKFKFDQQALNRKISMIRNLIKVK